MAGLVAGGDILAQLAGQPLGDCLLIPGCMLRHEGYLFLDDTPLPRLQEVLGVPVRVVPQNEKEPSKEEAGTQMQLMSPKSEQIIDRLKSVDVNALTPIECMNLLYELSRLAR